MKDRLIFDVTSAATILDSDSVGAFVRSSDGTLITHTTNVAKEGLDVNVINDSITIDDGGSSITVDASDLDIRNLTAASDSVQAWLRDGAGTVLTSTLVGSDQALDVNVVSGINVEVDLSHLDDSVRLGDGTNFLTSTTVSSDIGLDVYLINSSISVTQGTSPWVIGDGGSSITVDASDLDIRDLTQSDEITAYQGTDPWVVNDAALANTAILSAADTLAAAGTAEKVVASNLANRKYLFVYNNFNRKIYVGGSSVDKDNGFPISPGSYIEMRAGASVDVYYDSEANSAAIRTLELS